ncbi:cobalt-precorrin-6A reductase [Synechocystis sp. PCC 7509]|uniref:cobalt-precorrin-6A reductase n=1 Tax=Synechocystis sp. PCC 7509 TaxID=927677 RepID=UPI0002AC60C4|nr:cobalt-precorrin-6A reductase [Synechocystis sp. PCC 7509]
MPLIDYTRRLWLIGGTTESAAIAAELSYHSHISCVVSVTTVWAQNLYPPSPNLQVWVGRLDSQQLEAFLCQQKITAVLDASHPYATEISQRAISITQKLQIPYLRYERPAIDDASVINVDSFNTLLSGDYLHSHRVLLTVGYRTLPLFQSWQEKSTLFARILPSAIALETALNSGFPNSRLICLRPPISLELERSLWQQWQISLVVSKASGAAGGEAVKRLVAQQLNIPLIVVARPVISYPQQTSDLATALEFIQIHC